MRFLIILTLFSFVSGYYYSLHSSPLYNIPIAVKNLICRTDYLEKKLCRTGDLETHHRHYFPHYNEKKTNQLYQYAAYPAYQRYSTLSIDIDNIPKTQKKNFIDLYLEQYMMNHWTKNILSRTDDVEREKLLNRLLWVLQSDMYHRNSNKFVRQHLLNDLTGNILNLKDKRKQEQQLRQLHFLMQNGMLNENGNLALLIPEIWGDSYDKNMILPDIFREMTDLSIILLGTLRGSFDPYTMIFDENLDDYGSMSIMMYPEIFGFGSNYFGSNYQLQDYYYDSDGLLQLMLIEP